MLNPHPRKKKSNVGTPSTTSVSDKKLYPIFRDNRYASGKVGARLDFGPKRLGEVKYGDKHNYVYNNFDNKQILHVSYFPFQPDTTLPQAQQYSIPLKVLNSDGDLYLTEGGVYTESEIIPNLMLNIDRWSGLDKGVVIVSSKYENDSIKNSDERIIAKWNLENKEWPKNIKINGATTDMKLILSLRTIEHPEKILDTIIPPPYTTTIYLRGKDGFTLF